MITLEEVAGHWRLTAASVRARISSGELRAVRVAGRLRTDWSDVWACESGRRPSLKNAARYRTKLLTKQDLAGRINISIRTVERWIDRGLPTRNVGTNVRINQHDASDWLRRANGIELSADGARISEYIDQ